MLVNFFFVLSEASSDTITKWDFPLFTDFSVENSPLTTFLALVARPTRLNSLLLSAKFFHLLFQKKELNVFGSRNALKKDFVELIDLVKEGKVPVKGIITNIYKFEDGAKAFNDFANNPGNMLKVILDFTDR